MGSPRLNHAATTAYRTAMCHAAMVYASKKASKDHFLFFTRSGSCDIDRRGVRMR
jgi:hypothetical protein